MRRTASLRCFCHMLLHHSLLAFVGRKRGYHALGPRHFGVADDRDLAAGRSFKARCGPSRRIGKAAVQPHHLGGLVIDQMIMRAPAQIDRIVRQCCIKGLARRHDLVVSAIADQPRTLRHPRGGFLQTRDHRCPIFQRRHLNINGMCLDLGHAADMRVRVNETGEHGPPLEVDHLRAWPPIAADIA